MREHERRPRIAFFTEASPETRASSFRLLAELSRFASITVSIPKAPSGVENLDLESPRIEIQHRPWYGGTRAGFVRRIPSLLIPTWRAIVRAVDGADVVLSRIPSPIVGLVDRAARRSGCPHVLYVIADIESAALTSNGGRASPVRALKRMAGRWVRRRQQRLAKGRLVVAIGREQVDTYRDSARRCELLYASSVRKNEIFPRVDSCQSAVVELLHVTRLVPLKGTEFLLDALRRLRGDGYDVHLTIVGSGPLLGRLKRVCRRWDLQEHVAFAGTIPYGERLLEIYRSADIFVHPSLSESFPRVLWEAMAAHLPIVATCVGDVGRFLQERSAGLAVPSHSGEDLAVAVSRIIEDGGLRRALIRRGGELVRQFTAEEQGRRLWELLREELNESEAPRARSPRRARSDRSAGREGVASARTPPAEPPEAPPPVDPSDPVP